MAAFHSSNVTGSALSSQTISSEMRQETGIGHPSALSLGRAASTGNAPRTRSVADRQTHMDQVAYDGGVAEKDGRPHGRRVSDKLVDLHGQVKASGKDGKPFGPGPEAPEAVGLDEADGGVGEGADGEQPQSRAGGPCRRLDEDARVVARGIQVQV